MRPNGLVAHSEELEIPGEEVFEALQPPEDHPMGCCESGCELCMPEDRLFLDAWLAQGFTWNPQSPSNGFNTPVTFNDRSNAYQMNQLYLSLGWPVRQDAYCWDLGAQVDLLYGTDYFYTTALGLETELDGTQRWNSDSGSRGAALYGLAMPQLFMDVFVPWGHGVTVRLGHFYSTLGYETVPAPTNYFYSHSYAFQYGQPKTHTGFLTSFDLAPRLAMQAGFTRGWDTWEDPNGQNGFLGGLCWQSWDQQSSLAFTIHSGKEDPDGTSDRTVYTLLLTRHLSPCMTYVFENTFGTEENAEIDNNFQLDSAKWYGICQYIYFACSPTTSWGLRIEWFRDQDNSRVLGIPQDPFVSGGNYTALTFGYNTKLKPWMTFRPEIRWDSSDVNAPALGLDGMFNDFLDDDQITVAADLVITL
jgi:hypothetical protein